MNKKMIAMVFGVALLNCANAVSADSPLKAKADLLNEQGTYMGSATFSETGGGVRLVVKVRGLAPGEHGFHIHAVGSCEPPEFKSAGGHYNPFGKKHGAKNPEGMHAGDLPNLTVKADGSGTADVVVPHVTLRPEKGSLFHEGGTSLVIHAGPDDGVTDPAGNSGKRIACGVIVSVE